MRYTVFGIGIVFFLIGCASEEGSEEANNQDTTEETIEAEDQLVSEDESDDPIADLTLNDGVKWKTDSSTFNGMSTIDAMMNDWEGELDYVKIGEDVHEELNIIISNCTMKGEDHDQFHIILHAMLQECKALKNGEKEDDLELTRFVVAYFDHFEL